MYECSAVYQVIHSNSIASVIDLAMQSLYDEHQWRIEGVAELAAAPPPFFRLIFVFLADFFFFRAEHRGIWIPGPPFLQILDPPLDAMLYTCQTIV